MQFRHKPRDDGSRHIVREVSRHPRFFVRLEECLEVELEKVNVLDAEILAALEFLFQKFDTLFVDLDSSELHGAVEQVFRQRAVPRADLQHGLARLRRQIPRNHLRGRNIQEILTKLTATCSIHIGKDSKYRRSA